MIWFLPFPLISGWRAVLRNAGTFRPSGAYEQAGSTKSDFQLHIGKEHYAPIAIPCIVGVH